VFLSSILRTKITNLILRTSDTSKKPVKSFLAITKNCWLPCATSKSVPEYESSDCVYLFLAKFCMGIGFIGPFSMATVHNFYQDGCKLALQDWETR